MAMAIRLSAIESPNRFYESEAISGWQAKCVCMDRCEFGGGMSLQPGELKPKICVGQSCKCCNSSSTKRSFIEHKRVSKIDNEIVRNLAINMLYKDTERKLHIVNDSIQCQKNKNFNGKDLPLRLFSWSFDDFQQRREYENTLWVDVLLRQCRGTCIQTLKFKSDLEELLNYNQLVFTMLLKERVQLKTIQYNVINALKRVCEYLQFTDKLEAEVANKKVKLQELQIKQKRMNDRTETYADRVKFRLALEGRFMDAKVYDPIEVRYRLRHINSRSDQVDEKLQKLHNNIEEEISELNNKIDKEECSSECALNTYYTEIENFKMLLSDLNEKYEKDYDSIENKLTYKKTSMEKLFMQRKFFEEEMVGFQAVLRDLAEKEKIQRQRLETKKSKSQLLETQNKKSKGKSKKKRK